MLAVVGAAVGSWSVRAAVVDAEGRALLGFEVVEGTDPDERTTVALDLIGSLGTRYGAAAHDSVLVVPDEPSSRIGTDMFAIHDADQVHLASELGAQVTYLQARGLIEECRHIAIIDAGRSGVGVSVVDVVGGEVLGSGHCRLFGGDYCADMVYQYLLDAVGPELESADPAEVLPLEFGSEWAVEMLAAHRSVRVPGPFVGGTARLWRQTLDDLIAPGLQRAIRWAREGLVECPVRIDAVALLGGCANLPTVRARFSDALGHRIIAPTAPETASAKGAALLAARTAGGGRVGSTGDAHPERRREPAAGPGYAPGTHRHRDVPREAEASVGAATPRGGGAPFEPRSAARGRDGRRDVRPLR